MTKTGPTAADFADYTVAATRRTAWLTLATATAASMAGNIYHAAHYGGGSAVAMGAAAVVPALLLLAVHLVGGLAASRREGRVHRGVHPTAVIGVSALAAAALAASFLALRDLLLRERFDPIAAVLIPAAVDVAVVVATLALFSLAPGNDTSATETARPGEPQIARGPRTAEAETTRGARLDAQEIAQPDTVQSATAEAVQHAQPPAQLTTCAPPEPRTPRTAHGPRAETQNAHPTPSADEEALAARITAAGVTSKPTESVAAVLAAHAAGWSVSRIERELRVHRDVVNKIRDAAAAEPVPSRLAAVR